MSLADRLRSVIRPHGGDGSEDPSLQRTKTAGGYGQPNGCSQPNGCRDGSSDPSPPKAADILGGEWRDWNGHPYLVVDRTYAPGHRHGYMAVVDGSPGTGDWWPSLSILEPSLNAGRLLFIDLETTGLAGGAGTYAFLVGCGWFEGATFRVRQFLLAGFGAERGLLADVASMAAGLGGVATYNGKTFDLPLIETRFLFHRLTLPFAGMPHVDLLHAARRLWSVRGPGFADVQDPSSVDPANSHSCRLTAIEQSVLGHVREGDVPGFEIPSRYFHYVRSGDPRPLVAVLEHNRLDILSLAMVTARIARLLEEGAGAARPAREAYGLGRLYERGGRLDQAAACFAQAADTGGDDDPDTAAEALRACAVLWRRGRRYEEAAAAWTRLLALRRCPPRFVQEAAEALAIHHEHRRRELSVARGFALQSLQLTTSAARQQAIHHRLTRLDRKLSAPEPSRTGPPSADLAPMF